MKTTAAVLVETGRPLELAELEFPAIKAGQVIVEIAYSGVCGTQLLEARGHRGEDKWLPHLLGHEATGTVLEVGPDVAGVAVDDKVVLSWLEGPGATVFGTAYKWGSRNVNAGPVTTFQKHALVSESRVSKLPAGVDMRSAVMLGCALPTGAGAVFNVLKVRPGESIAIFGAGGIGQCAVMAARVADCAPIVVIDPMADKRKLAESFGATHTIDPTTENVAARINEIVKGGVDAAVEATGIPGVMAAALQSVRMRGGRSVVIGNARAGQNLDIDPKLFNMGKSLLGTWGGDSVPERDFPRYGEMLGGGKIDVKDLLSGGYRLGTVNQALDDMEAGRVGRPVIDMSA